MRKILLFALLLATLGRGVSAQTPAGAYTSPAGSSSGGGITSGGYQGVSSGYTFFLSSSGACTTVNAGGGTVCGTPNLPNGLATVSGADAGAVIRSAITNMGGTCGELDFKSGIFPINTFLQENTGGFTNFYAIGIPPTVTAGQYCQWRIKGERTPPAIDQFGTGVQTSGVILNVTAAAISTITATSKVMAIWVRPDVALNAGPSVLFDSIDVRFPDNQRGCETGIDVTQALNSDYSNVNVDTNVAQGSLLVPTAVTTCGSTTGTDLVGVTSTQSSKEENYFKSVYVEGYNVGFDIQSEHTYAVNSYAVNSNHGWDVGVRGSIYTAPSTFEMSGCSGVIRCLTLGANMVNKSQLNLIGWVFEDSGAAPFNVPVYHILETNAGFSSGVLSYFKTPHNHPLLNPFDGGGGAGFTLASNILPLSTLAHVPASDTFTRANSANIGQAWELTAGTSFNGGFAIVGNTAQGSINTSVAQVYVGQQFYGDQCSQVTVSAIDASASTNIQVMTNMDPLVFTNYGYYASHAAATGSGIFKTIAGSQTNLSVQTGTVGVNAGDTLQLCHIGTKIYAYRNGVLDVNIPVNPSTDASIGQTGQPALAMAQDATGAISLTNFVANWTVPNTATSYTVQGNPCTNAELVLSAGWQSTGSATVTAAAGTGQTCAWTITTGTTTAANPTVTDTLTNPLPTYPGSLTVCELNIHGGTHTAAAGEGFTQTTVSATAPIFTFIGTPTNTGATYFVTRRCGP